MVLLKVVQNIYLMLVLVELLVIPDKIPQLLLKELIVSLFGWALERILLMHNTMIQLDMMWSLNLLLMTELLLEVTEPIFSLRLGLMQELLVDVIQCMEILAVFNMVQELMTLDQLLLQQFLDKLLKVMQHLVRL